MTNKQQVSLDDINDLMNDSATQSRENFYDYGDYSPSYENSAAHQSDFQEVENNLQKTPSPAPKKTGKMPDPDFTSQEAMERYFNEISNRVSQSVGQYGKFPDAIKQKNRQAVEQGVQANPNLPSEFYNINKEFNKKNDPDLARAIGVSLVMGAGTQFFSDKANVKSISNFVGGGVGIGNKDKIDMISDTKLAVPKNVSDGSDAAPKAINENLKNLSRPELLVSLAVRNTLTSSGKIDPGFQAEKVQTLLSKINPRLGSELAGNIVSKIDKNQPAQKRLAKEKTAKLDDDTSESIKEPNDQDVKNKQDAEEREMENEHQIVSHRNSPVQKNVVLFGSNPFAGIGGKTKEALHKSTLFASDQVKRGVANFSNEVQQHSENNSKMVSAFGLGAMAAASPMYQNPDPIGPSQRNDLGFLEMIKGDKEKTKAFNNLPEAGQTALNDMYDRQVNIKEIKQSLSGTPTGDRFESLRTSLGEEIMEFNNSFADFSTSAVDNISANPEVSAHYKQIADSKIIESWGENNAKDIKKYELGKLDDLGGKLNNDGSDSKKDNSFKEAFKESIDGFADNLTDFAQKIAEAISSTLDSVKKILPNSKHSPK